MIRLAEPMFVTLQGEGKYTGRRSIFARLTGCNFRCEWANGTRCDTPYSSWEPEFNGAFDPHVLQNLWLENVSAHLVITGGEPLMQPTKVEQILEAWDNRAPVTIETNGSLPMHLPHVEKGLLSISPKINTKEKHDLEWYAEQINKLLKLNDIQGWQHQLKFVVQDKSDIEVIEDLVCKTYVAESDVYLMACGTTAKDVDAKAQWIADECIAHGYNYTDRLHLRLWGGGRGR